jgi:hypothetical protein
MPRFHWAIFQNGMLCVSLLCIPIMALLLALCATQHFTRCPTNSLQRYPVACQFITRWKFNNLHHTWGGPLMVAQWLRYCATNRKGAGSIQDGVIGIFHWHNPSDRTMAMGSTQPLTEMSTRSISWGKGGRCVRLSTLPPSCAVVMQSGNLNFLEPSGPLQACNRTALPFTPYV